MSNIPIHYPRACSGEKSKFARNRASRCWTYFRDADPNREIVQREVNALSHLSGDTTAGPVDRA